MSLSFSKLCAVSPVEDEGSCSIGALLKELSLLNFLRPEESENLAITNMKIKITSLPKAFSTAVTVSGMISEYI